MSRQHGERAFFFASQISEVLGVCFCISDESLTID